MNRINTKRTIHNNKAVVKLNFDYNAALVAILRQQLLEAHWSRTMRCWYVKDQFQKIMAFQNIGIRVEQETVSDIIVGENNADILKYFFDYVKGKRYSEKQ